MSMSKAIEYHKERRKLLEKDTNEVNKGKAYAEWINEPGESVRLYLWT